MAIYANEVVVRRRRDNHHIIFENKTQMVEVVLTPTIMRKLQLAIPPLEGEPINAEAQEHR